MENFLDLIRPQPDGTPALPLGDKPGLPMLSIAEYGGPVAGVFKEGADVWSGKVVNAVSQYCTGQEFVDAWSKAIGKEVKYFACPMEMFAGFGFPGDAELAEMFVAFTMDYVSAEDMVTGAKLHPAGKFSTVAEFFEKNKEKATY
jgi:hypothetical protein